MSSYAVMDLRNELIWDTGRLMAAAFRWPTLWPLLRLEDIGIRVEPAHFLQQGTQVIVPEGLDRVHGGVRRRTKNYQGAGFLVGGDAQNLQIGDVLVPAQAELPALMVHANMSGSTVSRGFSVYRFMNSTDAYWVWALLSSVSGRTFRRGFLADTFSKRGSRIGSAPLPWPDDETRARLSGPLAAVESRFTTQEEEAVGTWWTTSDLRQLEWRIALATPEPERLYDGVSLNELALEIKLGKTFDRSAVRTVPVDGMLPVTNGAVLAGRPITRWLDETSDTAVAEIGDLLLAVVGERANARIVEQRTIIDAGVFRIRLVDPLLAKPVVAFLNGQVGFGLRKILLSGALVPRVNRRDLGQLRVPESVFNGEELNGPLEPLAEQLERMLWTT